MKARKNSQNVLKYDCLLSLAGTVNIETATMSRDVILLIIGLGRYYGRGDQMPIELIAYANCMHVYLNESSSTLEYFRI